MSNNVKLPPGFTEGKNSKTVTQTETTTRKNGGKLGGSITNVSVRGRVVTRMSIPAAFQEANKLTKSSHVRLIFNEKTKVLGVIFVDAAGDGTYSIDRDKSGYGKVHLTAFLKQYGVQLKSDMYCEEYVFSKEGILTVDLSDNVEKHSGPEIKRDEQGRLAKLTAKEKAERQKQAEERFEA